jgi:riboflavin synthase
MFTGIIRAVGSVHRVEHRATGARLTVTCPQVIRDIEVSDSVAINGVCLTVTEILADGFVADVSEETLARSNLLLLGAGTAVNMETSLRLGDKLGGHLIFGHVDGLGTIVNLRRMGEFYDLGVEFPANLTRYIAEKGSIAVDGISLTVASLVAARFSAAVIPFTFDQTNLRHRRVGDRVNLEVDMLARYVERMLRSSESTGLSEEFLSKHGFA